MVAANWKLNGSAELCREFASNLISPDDVDICLFPTSIHLATLSAMCNGSVVATGAQNVYFEVSGAYTGEISATMVAELGAEFVLVGHSERRTIFGETDSEIARKFEIIMEAGLTPVLCIGETLEERESEMAVDIVQRQLHAVEKTWDHPAFLQTLIAYEPVWAIGTGHAATPEMAQEMHATIRKTLFSISSECGQKIRILYGGSVKEENAKALYAKEDIDGFLVGGASLDVKEFNQICNAVVS